MGCRTATRFRDRGIAAIQNQGRRHPPTGPQSHAADRDRGCASLRPAAALAPSATDAERTATNPKRRYLHTSADISYGREQGVVTGIAVAVGALVLDENEIYDLTNIGTLSAFAIVCIGVYVLRRTEPDRVRPFRVPFLPFVSLAGAAACVYIMFGLPAHAWERFGIWLVIGLAIYIGYGYRHSRLRAENRTAG